MSSASDTGFDWQVWQEFLFLGYSDEAATEEAKKIAAIQSTVVPEQSTHERPVSARASSQRTTDLTDPYTYIHDLSVLPSIESDQDQNHQPYTTQAFYGFDGPYRGYNVPGLGNRDRLTSGVSASLGFKLPASCYPAFQSSPTGSDPGVEAYDGQLTYENVQASQESLHNDFGSPPPEPGLIHMSESPQPSSSPQQRTPRNYQASQTRFRTSEARPVTPGQFPDTYRGRRTAAARANYPWACSACVKNFLYEDSAVKHYRKHHGEPVNIILRYDAPKRPRPAQPRNFTSAKSQVRRGMTPSEAQSAKSGADSVPLDIETVRPTGKPDANVSISVVPDLVYMSTDEDVQPHEATSPAPPSLAPPSLAPSSLTPGLLATAEGSSRAISESIDRLSSILSPALFQPHHSEPEQGVQSTIEPQQATFQSKSIRNSVSSILDPFTDEVPSRFAHTERFQATLANRRPPPHVPHSNFPDNAQDAIRNLRRRAYVYPCMADDTDAENSTAIEPRLALHQLAYGRDNVSAPPPQPGSTNDVPQASHVLDIDVSPVNLPETTTESQISTRQQANHGSNIVWCHEYQKWSKEFGDERRYWDNEVSGWIKL